MSLLSVLDGYRDIQYSLLLTFYNSNLSLPPTDAILNLFLLQLSFSEVLQHTFYTAFLSLFSHLPYTHNDMDIHPLR